MVIRLHGSMVGYLVGFDGATVGGLEGDVVGFEGANVGNLVGG